MARDDIIARRDFREIPPRVEYSATPFGLTLATTVAPLCDWGCENMDRLETLANDAAVA